MRLGKCEMKTLVEKKNHYESDEEEDEKLI
jgi:hypothetical protein